MNLLRPLPPALAIAASAALLTFAHPASADSYCIPGTPVCATETQNGVKVGAPKVSAGGSTSGTVQGSAGGGASGQFTPPTVQGSVGGGTVSVATPALDLSWVFTGAAQVAAGVSGAFGGGASGTVQTEVPGPPAPSVPMWASGRGWQDLVYTPEIGGHLCAGLNASTSFFGPTVCIGLDVFPTRWLSIENEVFYTYGTSVDDAPAFANLQRHAAMYQPAIAFHAQSDGFRFSGRVGGTIEVGSVSRGATSCATTTDPGTVSVEPLCAPLDAVSEARAYAGGMTGFSLGYAEGFVAMLDFRFVAKARIDAGDRDDPLGRAELGGLFMFRIGGESGSWVAR